MRVLLSTKAKISLRGISKRYKTIEAYALVQRRFFLLSLLLPLTSMVTTIIYNKTANRNYSNCLKDNKRPDHCIYENVLNPAWLDCWPNQLDP